MTIEQFLNRLRQAPESVVFSDVLALIDSHYEFTPSAFRNGSQLNSTDANQGSCKVLAFAHLQQLDREQTLACFGQYYRDDVLGDPDGNSHANIRNFLRHGWDGVEFDQFPLRQRTDRAPTPAADRNS